MATSSFSRPGADIRGPARSVSGLSSIADVPARQLNQPAITVIAIADHQVLAMICPCRLSRFKNPGHADAALPEAPRARSTLRADARIRRQGSMSMPGGGRRDSDAPILSPESPAQCHGLCDYDARSPHLTWNYTGGPVWQLWNVALSKHETVPCTAR